MSIPSELVWGVALMATAFLVLNYALYRRITRPSLGLFAQPKMNESAAMRSEAKTSYRFTIQNYEEEDLPGPIMIRIGVVGDGELMCHGSRDPAAQVDAYVGPDCSNLQWQYTDNGRSLVIGAPRMRALKAWAFEVPVTRQTRRMRIEVALQQPALLRDIDRTLPLAETMRARNAYGATLDVGDAPASTGHERSRVPGWWLYALTLTLSALLYLAVRSITSWSGDMDARSVIPGLDFVDLVVFGAVALVSLFAFLLLRREPVSAAQGYFGLCRMSAKEGKAGELRPSRALMEAEDIDDAEARLLAPAGPVREVTAEPPSPAD